MTKCHLAQDIVASLSAIDSILVTDRIAGMINLVSTELLARKAYARERAFEDCKAEEDWRKPRGDPKGWRSKVKFDLLTRFDPKMTEEEVLRVPGAEDEVRREIDRDVSFEKARSKLEKHGAAIQLQELL